MATDNSKDNSNLTEARRKLRLSVEFEAFFYAGCYQIGEVEPLREYSQDRNRPGRQVRDEETGLLVWKITVSDPALVDKPDRASYAVHILSDVEPVPTTSHIAPNLRPIALEGLTLQPRLKGSGEFKHLAFQVRATGYAPAPGGRSPGGGKSGGGTGNPA